MAEELGKLTPLLHGSPQPVATVMDRSSDPREPEAAAADAELRHKGGILPPMPVVQGLSDRTADIATPDMLASEAAVAEADAAAAEMDRGLAQLGRGDAPAQHAPAAQAGGHGQAGWAQQGQHSVAEVAGGGEHQAPPGIPSASVAERPNPGTGSSRVGARRGTTALVDPQTEAELAAAGLPGA